MCTHPLLKGTDTHIQKLYFQIYPPVYGMKYYVIYSYSHPVQGVVVQPHVKVQIGEG
jgi:hypothetical protein